MKSSYTLPVILLAATAVPAFARGGKIAFTSDRPGARDIFVMNPDGSGLTNVTNSAGDGEEFPNWSADGSRLIYNRNGDVWYANADGSSPTDVPTGHSSDYATFIPGTSRIGYSRFGGQDYDIYSADLDGGNEKLVASHQLGDYGAQWSPDGTQLIYEAFEFVGNGIGINIFAADPDGSNAHKITTTNADRSGAWSPDGGKIVFQSQRDGNQEIYVMNADGSNPKRLTNNTADDIDPFFSPDGKRIVFQSNRDGNQEIYVMKADGTNQTRLTNDPGEDKAPSWGPDFVAGAPDVSIGDIAIQEGTGGTRTAPLRISLSAPSANPVYVTYSSYDGTAKAGSDYTPEMLQTVVIPAGVSAVTVTVPIVTDAVAEPDETFTVRISAEGAVVKKQSGTVTIINDDVDKHSISGRCISTYADSTFNGSERSGIAGVTVQLLNASNTVILTTQTNQNGDFTFPDIKKGNYSLTATTSRPGLSDVVMDPPSRPVTVGNADVVVNRFALYSIFGIVKIPSGNTNVPTSGATVDLYNANGIKIATRTTGADGRYEFRLQRAAGFTLKVTKSGYSYANRAVGLPTVDETWSPNARAHLVGTATKPSGESF